MRKHFPLVVIFVYLSVCNANVFAYQINITHFGNCEEHREVEIELKSVTYDYSSGFCDTLHGVYEIYVKRMNMEYEMWMTVNNCAKGSTGPCRDNEKAFIEPMKCERFHDDNSGPWYMISQATEHERCGEIMGTFKLTNATLKPEYLDNIITVDPAMTSYRIQMLFHKIGASVESEKKHIRGCINMEFELIL